MGNQRQTSPARPNECAEATEEGNAQPGGLPGCLLPSVRVAA